MFPQAVLLKGGVTDTGFFYDVELPQTIDEHLLPFLEQNVRTLAKENLPFRLQEMTRKNALEMFKYHQLLHQVEFLENSDMQTVQVVIFDDLHDLSDGEVIQTSAEIGALKLIDVKKISERAYRFEGTAFGDSYALKKFLKRLDALKKCDHRLLSKEMQLTASVDILSSHDIFWLPKGMIFKKEVISLIQREYHKRNFLPIQTPQLLNKEFLIKKRILSDTAFDLGDDDVLAGCAKSFEHATLQGLTPFSAEELPMRYVEWHENYHQETSPWGFFRSAVFSSDSSSIFCRKEQLVEEIISSLQFIGEILKILGFEHRCYMLSRGSKFAGTVKNWDGIASLFEEAAAKMQLKWELDPQKTSFAGPKFEFRITDALGREWTGPFVGIDLELPGRLGLHYQTADNQKQLAYMLVLSASTSIDRLLGLLIETHAGRIPLRLAPEHVRVIVVTPKYLKYAQTVNKELVKKNLRTTLDNRNTSLGARVHEAELQKIPYCVLIGDAEEKSKFITVRAFSKSTVKNRMELEEFIEVLSQEIHQQHHNEE